MTAPAVIVPVAEAARLREVLPEALRALPRWTPWTARPKTLADGTPKIDKVPAARTDDPTTWRTFDTALAGMPPAGKGGIGFILTRATGVENRGVWAVDLDGCRDKESGALSKLGQAILDAAPGIYTEISPSGRGLRVLGAGGVPTGLGEFLNRQAGVEFYAGASSRYVTITGAVLQGAGALAAMPAALAELLAQHATKRAADKPGAVPAAVPVMDATALAAVVARARLTTDQSAFLQDGGPPGARSEMLWGILRALAEAGLSPDEMYRAAISCPGIWKAVLSKRSFVERKAQQYLWAEVHRAARNESPGPGADSSPTEAGVLPEVASGFVADPAAAVQELNARYFIAPAGGRVRVFEEHLDPVLRRRATTLYSFEDFGRLHAHRTWFDHGRKMRLGAEWLQHPQARRFDRVVFDPSGREHAPGIYNLWRGFAVEPRRGDWSVIRGHIEEVIAGGDPRIASYVILWMARLIQRPGEPGEVALVFRSGEGTGKGLTVRALRNLLGQHALHVTQASHLTGNFNGHLRDAVLVFADECFFAGDRQHASVLKALVTEEWLMLERKGIDAEPVPNYGHLILSSNARWVVPASLDSRRYFVAEVSEHRKGDRTYFARLAAATEDLATLGAMLWDLQRLDLSGFEVRDIPRTAALDDQRSQSLEGPLAWLRDVLSAGTLAVAEDYPTPWREFGTTQELHASFERWRRGQRFERSIALNAFARVLTQVFGPVLRRAPAGLANRVSNPDARGFPLGTLPEARARFLEATGLGAAVFDATPAEEVDPLG